ncbi:MAG: ABC-F family ATP-binding cassette domain-containing protein [Acidimicrobiales bacterium]
MLQVRDLDVEVGGRLVVSGACFSVGPGDKAGLVGRNGAGKTSMLKVLGAGAEPAGGVVLRKGALGYLSQDPRAGDAGTDSSATALSHILSGRNLDEAAVRLEKLRIALEEDPSDRNVGRFTRAEEAFGEQGGYEAESEAHRLAAGLGVDRSRMVLGIRALSGGERRRVELARILFAGSDLLLLDEPTNHLDIDAREWLMGFLRSYRGALVVVSHDLDLLDEAITRVLHLDRGPGESSGHLVEYRGTYSQYLSARRRDEERLARVAERQAGEIRRLGGLADSMRHQTAKRARVAKTLDRRVERIKSEIIEGPASNRQVNVRLPHPPHAGRVVCEVEHLAKSFGGTEVFEEVSFGLERGERLLVMGLNGAGKTTLLRLLAGVSEPSAGEVSFGLGVSVGYYAQEHEGIVSGRSVIEHMRESSGAADGDLRGLLGMFGLSGAIAFQDAGTMSGGEKTKLALAQLTAGRHNLLLLDEPTNNLDPPSRTAIGLALKDWSGAMILVSHDPDFVQELGPERVLMMPDGTLDYYSDDLAELVALA